jgi:hypothetical protein
VSRISRQLLALVVLLLAGLASLATSVGPPAVTLEAKDRLSFSGDQRIEVRRVRVEVVASDRATRVWADVPIDIGAVDGKRPVTLTVIRDRDGESVLDDFGPDYQPGTLGSLAGSFEPIEVCSRGATCVETFTFTFERIPEDTRQSLEFEWSVRARAESPDLDPGASPPSDASLRVEIRR